MKYKIYAHRIIYVFISLLIVSSLIYTVYSYMSSDEVVIMSESQQSNIHVVDKSSTSTDKLTVLFAGDIMLDRHIRRSVNTLGIENFKESYIRDLIEQNKNYDLVIANLEGPITDEKSLTVTEDNKLTQAMHFTFDPVHSGAILKALNIDAVSLANNHTDNFYYAGFTSTMKYLEGFGIMSFGNPYNSTKEKISDIICVKGVCIALIGYNQFTTENDGSIIAKEIKNLIYKKEKGEIDFIFVMPHYGEEYEKSPSERQVIMSREWIDAGADAVIGAHSHVVGDIEDYRGSKIFYSLGNYIFDQWFTPDVRVGMQVPITLTKDTITRDGKTQIVRNLEYDDLLYTYISRDKIIER